MTPRPWSPRTSPPAAEPADGVLEHVWPVLEDERATALRRRWYRETTARAWLDDLDWWHPACDAVVEALVTDGPVEAAARRLGAVRAELGCTAEETVDDVVALWDAARAVDPPARVLRELVGGWAESGLDPVGAASCTDPVTALATSSHLNRRLVEMYRDPRPGTAAGAHVLVVLDLCFPLLDPSAGREAFARVAAVSRAAEVVRRAFPAAVVHARVAPTRVAVLTPTGAPLTDGLAAVEALLDGASRASCGSEEAIATWWVESLPATTTHLGALLSDLSR